MLIVTANSKNTFDAYCKYVHYTDRKRHRAPSASVTGWLLFACTAAVAVSLAILGGNVFLYVVLGVLVICAAAFVYIQYLAPYRAYKKLGDAFSAEQEFDFYDDRLEVIVNGKQKTLSRLPYSKIERVCDTKHAFYLYLGKDRALILSKDAMTASQCDKLRALFKEKNIKVTE